MIIPIFLAFIVIILISFSGQYANHTKLFWWFITFNLLSIILTNLWKRAMVKLNAAREKGEKLSRLEIVIGSFLEFTSGTINYLMLGTFIWIISVIIYGIFSKIFH